MKQVVRVFLPLVFAVATFSATAVETPTQKHSDRGVTVAVSPRNISEDAKTWDFNIVFDTHTQNLSDDLLKSATLQAAGATHTPIAWDGAPPGSHHREGTLRFRPIKPLPETMELKLQRPGEPAPRTFTWKLR